MKNFSHSVEYLYEQLAAFCLKFSFKGNRHSVFSPFLPQAGLQWMMYIVKRLLFQPRRGCRELVDKRMIFLDSFLENCAEKYNKIKYITMQFVLKMFWEKTPYFDTGCSVKGDKIALNIFRNHWVF